VLRTVKSGKFIIESNAMDVVRRNGVTVSFAFDRLPEPYSSQENISCAIFLPIHKQTKK